MEVEFEGFVVSYEEPPVDIGEDSYSILVDGSIRDMAGNLVHEGYFYVIAPRKMYGSLDLGVGSPVQGRGEMVVGGGEPVVRMSE